MKKLLLASPLKLGARPTYLGALADTCQRGVPGWQIDSTFMSGPCAAFCRNELAHFAVSQNYDRILFVDEDLVWSHEHVVSVLSHDVPIVGGRYCVKQGGEPKWLYRPLVNTPLEEGGLIECEYLATGFMSISWEALRTIADNFPDRHFTRREDSEELIAPRFEWFPQEIVGDGSPGSRLERVEEILEWADGDAVTAVRAIRDAVERPHAPGTLMGEDYNFCRLAREAGLSVFVDHALLLPHIGEASYPMKAAT